MNAAPGRTVAMLHTVATLPPLFTGLLAERAPDLRVFHLVDESMLADTIAAGRLPPRVRRRVATHAAAAQESGAAALLVTCSSIGAAAESAGQLVDIPVLRVDRPMAVDAVERYARIGVLATLESTLGPTTELIRRTAADRKLDRQLSAQVCAGAFDTLRSGDRAGHDRLVADAAARLADEVDVLVLAQASMADALAGRELPVPVLTSPRSGVAALVAALVSPMHE